MLYKHTKKQGNNLANSYVLRRDYLYVGSKILEHPAISRHQNIVTEGKALLSHNH